MPLESLPFCEEFLYRLLRDFPLFIPHIQWKRREADVSDEGTGFSWDVLLQGGVSCAGTPPPVWPRDISEVHSCLTPVAHFASYPPELG